MRVIKFTDQYAHDYKQVLETIDLGESVGEKFIRIKTTEKVRLSLNVTIEQAQNRRILGFEEFNINRKNGRKVYRAGQLILWPTYDHFLYGYVPATERNLTLLAASLKDGKYTIDEIDSESRAKLEAIMEKRGWAKERIGRRDMDGILEDKDAARKELRLKSLRDQVADKKVDEEIAELEAQLRGPKKEDTVITAVIRAEAPVDDEEPVVEQDDSEEEFDDVEDPIESDEPEESDKEQPAAEEKKTPRRLNKVKLH